MKSQTNKQVIFQYLIVILCCLNLLYMHYNVFTDRNDLGTFPYIENFCFTIIDCCILFIIPFIIIKKRFYLYFILLIFINIISLANIWYSRYFSSYIPLSLYTEFGNLNGLSANITNVIELRDSIIPSSLITGILFYLYYKKQIKSSLNTSRIRQATILGGIGIFLISILIGISAMRWKDLSWKYITPYNYNPVQSTFQFGIVHSYIVEWKRHHNKSYSVKELKVLEPYITGETINMEKEHIHQNFILIIVESLLSYATNLTVDNIEITPNLNKLVKEGAYYNDNMMPQIQAGESIDGQLIYLTGLLPKKQGITINDYLNNTFISLPSLFKEKGLITKMIIPTSSTMWQQNKVCLKFEIKSLFARNSYPNQEQVNGWLTDQQLFQYAAMTDSTNNQRFMSVILTSSTHSPYSHSIKEYSINYPNNYSNELKNYLSNVHYMDVCLGEYFHSLKVSGLYDNSLIIIVSDHQAHDFLLNANNLQIPSLIPLYIINSPKEIKKDQHHPIKQCDVFPTILDLMGIDSKWRGVGNSILIPDSFLNTPFQRKREENMQRISNIILDSDYFNHNPLK